MAKTNPNDQNAVCISRYVEDSSQMVFLYQGIQGGLFLEPLEFIRKSGAVSRNISMFRDFSHSYFHGRIHPDWPDIDTAIDNQRRIMQDCSQARELYCAGTSTGAYAAILFGHYLKADIVYAFAALTGIPAVTLSNIPVEVPPEHQDLKLLLSDWNGHTRYKLYYSQDYPPDVEGAERMAECPGVELIPLPGNDHNIFASVKPEDILTDLFPDPSDA